MTEPHSLLHGITAAKCKTPWESMPGAGNVRSCPQCKKTVIEASDLAEAELVKLICDAEPNRKVDEIRLYRRADGRLMTSQSNCNFATLVEFYFSWPIVLLLTAGYVAMVILSQQDQQQGYVVAFAQNMAFSSFMIIGAVAIYRRWIDVSLKGRLFSVRCYIGSIATIGLSIYTVLRLLNIPVWTFDKGVLVNLYHGSIIVGSFMYLIARSLNDARKKRAAIESRPR